MDSNIICIELDNVSKTKKAEVQIMEIKSGWKSPYALGRQGSKVKIDPEEVVWMMCMQNGNKAGRDSVNHFYFAKSYTRESRM